MLEILSLRVFIWWYCKVLNMNLKKWLDIPNIIQKERKQKRKSKKALQRLPYIPFLSENTTKAYHILSQT